MYNNWVQSNQAHALYIPPIHCVYKLNRLKRLWEPPFVPILEYNHQHRVSWYYVPISFIILCTSNSCEVFVLKQQPHIYLLLGDLDRKEVSKS